MDENYLLLSTLTGSYHKKQDKKKHAQRKEKRPFWDHLFACWFSKRCRFSGGNIVYVSIGCSEMEWTEKYAFDTKTSPLLIEPVVRTNTLL
jgi:hypothetical protein